MRKLLTTSTIFAFVSLLTLTVAAFGSPVSYDDFEDYTIGSSISGGGDGWLGVWETDSSLDVDVSVISGGLSYNAGDISISGGSQALQYVASEDSSGSRCGSRARAKHASSAGWYVRKLAARSS